MAKKKIFRPSSAPKFADGEYSVGESGGAIAVYDSAGRRVCCAELSGEATLVNMTFLDPAPDLPFDRELPPSAAADLSSSRNRARAALRAAGYRLTGANSRDE